MVLHQFRFHARILPSAAMAKQAGDTLKSEDLREGSSGLTLGYATAGAGVGKGTAMRVARSGQTDLVARVGAETCSDEEDEATARMVGVDGTEDGRRVPSME